MTATQGEQRREGRIACTYFHRQCGALLETRPIRRVIPERLAFVDIETSGTSPVKDRIVEIGVVLLDRGGVSQWSTLLDPRMPARDRPWRRPKYAAAPDARPPRFQDVAATLAGLFDGRLVIAHNARFDCNFLRAEFARAAVAFEPTVLCSVALSRRLYPDCARHDLDAIAQRLGLTVEARHRALPDADLVRRFWEHARSMHADGMFAAAVEELLAAPVYPEHLDIALIDRLPEAAGVYLLCDANGRALDAGAAFNLKRHVQNYFRVDALSARASAISHEIADIRWKTTRGFIGARLELLTRPEWRDLHDRRGGELHTWHLTPDRIPAVGVRPFDPVLRETGESYGLFASLRRARNALARLAAKRRLCLRMLGIAESAQAACGRCAADDRRPPCMRMAGRLRELVRVTSALSTLRKPSVAVCGTGRVA